MDFPDEDRFHVIGFGEGVLERRAGVAAAGRDRLRGMEVAEGDIVEVREGIGRDGAGAPDGERALGLGFRHAGDKSVGDEDARAAGSEIRSHALKAGAQGGGVVADGGIA